MNREYENPLIYTIQNYVVYITPLQRKLWSIRYIQSTFLSLSLHWQSLIHFQRWRNPWTLRTLSRDIQRQLQTSTFTTHISGKTICFHPPLTLPKLTILTAWPPKIHSPRYTTSSILPPATLPHSQSPNHINHLNHTHPLSRPLSLSYSIASFSHPTLPQNLYLPTKNFISSNVEIAILPLFV